MKKSHEYRKFVINVRVNLEERTSIKKKAFDAGLQPAIYIRESALEKEIKALITLEQMKQIRNVSSVSNNLNQITKAMHKHGLVNTAEEVEQILNQIKKLMI